MEMLPIRSLLKCMEDFRALEEQMPMQKAAVFLLVALHEGCTMRQLSNWLGVSLSTCSRNLAALGDVHRNGDPGLRVITLTNDPADPRRKLAFLTPKGQQIIASLTEHLA